MWVGCQVHTRSALHRIAFHWFRGPGNYSAPEQRALRDRRQRVVDGCATETFLLPPTTYRPPLLQGRRPSRPTCLAPPARGDRVFSHRRIFPRRATLRHTSLRCRQHRRPFLSAWFCTLRSSDSYRRSWGSPCRRSWMSARRSWGRPTCRVGRSAHRSSRAPQFPQPPWPRPRHMKAAGAQARKQVALKHWELVKPRPRRAEVLGLRLDAAEDSEAPQPMEENADVGPERERERAPSQRSSQRRRRPRARPRWTSPPPPPL